MDLTLFRPTKPTLREINFVNEPLKGSTQYNVYTPNTSTSALISGVLAQITEFYRPIYRWAFEQDSSVLVRQAVWILVKEAVSNGIVHGNQGVVMMGMFMGLEGMIYGFRDFGDYFTREDIKEKWEGKKPHSLRERKFEKKTVGEYQAGYGAGMEMIFDASDRIEVDTSLGVLYCTQNRERFLSLPNKDPS